MTSQNPTVFTPMQLDILQMFSHPMSDADIEELRDFLIEYFERKAQKELDRLIKSGELGEDKIKAMENSHIRTPYR